jgi:hypothetical protein
MDWEVYIPKKPRQFSVQECALESHVSYGTFGDRIHSSSDVNITNKFATCGSFRVCDLT